MKNKKRFMGSKTESVRLDKEVEKAKSQLKKCKGKYKEM
jgi:hypothetical protein